MNLWQITKSGSERHMRRARLGLILSGWLTLCVTPGASIHAASVAYIAVQPNVAVAGDVRNITAIDTILQDIAGTIEQDIGKVPLKVAFATNNGKRAYVTNFGDDSVSVITVRFNLVFDPQTDIIRVGEGPYGIAITPDGKLAYVANGEGASVSVIDLNSKRSTFHTVMETIQVDATPRGVAITPDGKKVYVGHLTPVDTATPAVLTIIDVESNQVIKTIQFQPQNFPRPPAIAMSPIQDFAYVTGVSDVGEGGRTVTIIDTVSDEVIGAIAVGERPTGIAFHPDGKWAYVANNGSDSVSVIDTQDGRVVDEIITDRNPFDLAVTPGGETLYVTFSAIGEAAAPFVAVFDANTLQSHPVVPFIGLNGQSLGMAVQDLLQVKDSPARGDVLRAGQSHTIKWRMVQGGAEDARAIIIVDHVELRYSTDGGNTFPHVIAEEAPAPCRKRRTSGVMFEKDLCVKFGDNFVWTVPPEDSDQVRIKVVAKGRTFGASSDGELFPLEAGNSLRTLAIEFSPANFTISPN